MKIEEMMQISYFLIAASIVFAVAAMILFFALDIVKCWKMLAVRHAQCRTNMHKIVKRDSDKKAKSKNAKQDKTENRIEESFEIKTAKLNNMETILLSQKTAADAANHTQPILLSMPGKEGTKQAEVQFELIQDIVYVQTPKTLAALKELSQHGG